MPLCATKADDNNVGFRKAFNVGTYQCFSYVLKSEAAYKCIHERMNQRYVLKKTRVLY